MEFEAKAADLLQAVTRAGLVVEKKVDNTLLTNIKIDAFPQGGLILTGSNLIMSSSCRCEASVGVIGSAAVDYQRLSALLAKLPTTKKVKLKLTDDGKFRVRSGSSKYDLLTMDVADFPLNPKPVKGVPIVDVKVDVLLDLIRTTEHSMLNDEQRAHLSGALLEFTKADAMCVTTDSQRLTKREVILETPDALRVFIPNRTVVTLRKFCETLSPTDVLKIQATAAYLFFWHDSGGFASKLIEAKPMDYTKVFSTTKPDASATVDRLDLLDALTRLKTIGDDPVRLYTNTKEDKLEITSSNPMAGTGAENVKGKLVGAEMEQVLSITHLIDFLGVVKAEKVKVSLNDISKKLPARVDPVGKELLTLITMPLAGLE